MGRASLALAFLCLAATFAPAEPINPGAIDVVDGDTINVGTHRYRLVGFDTPETKSLARCETERARGNAAAMRLRQLVAGGGLDLTRVPCACRPGTEDTPKCNFGRRCAVLTAAGRDVGQILIGDGLARPYVCKGTRCPPRGEWCQP